MLVPLVALMGAFDNAVYHVALGNSGSCFHFKEIMLLTGNVSSEAGGVLSVYSPSHSLPNFTISLTPNPHQHLPILVKANFTCRGVSQSSVGTALCGPNIHGAIVECQDIVLNVASGETPLAVITPGPGPAPPPPSCIVSQSKAACDAVTDCACVEPVPRPLRLLVGAAPSGCRSPPGESSRVSAGCSSNDKVHRRCFVKGHTPDPSAWTCDGDAWMHGIANI